MAKTMEQYKESVSAIFEKLGGFIPDIAMILGSGLGFMGDLVENPIKIPYGEVPHFKVSTAPGHAGQFVFGQYQGKNVAVMQGRQHYYEGYDFDDVTYCVRVLRQLGCKILVVTNAAGCVNEQWQGGDLMLITDHIKLSLDSPLRGENLPEFGTRFPDMSTAYSKRLGTIAKEVAKEQGLLLREGVYYFCAGPQYETPAEIRAVSRLGGDGVGMSTVPEVIVANHCGMEILGISLLTNMAAGILDKPLDEQEVLDVAAQAQGHFSALLGACVAKMTVE